MIIPIIVGYYLSSYTESDPHLIDPGILKTKPIDRLMLLTKLGGRHTLGNTIMHNNHKLLPRLHHLGILVAQQLLQLLGPLLDILQKLIGIWKMLIHKLHKHLMPVHLHLVLSLTPLLNFLDDIVFTGDVLQHPQLLVLDLVEEAEVQVHARAGLQDVAPDVAV